MANANDDAELPEILTVAFAAENYFKFVEEPVVERKWWQFWKPKVRTILRVDDLAWHYTKELESTHVDIIIATINQDSFKRICSLVDTLPGVFDCPPVALVPREAVASWKDRHSAYIIGSTLEHQKYLDRLILEHGVPESF